MAKERRAKKKAHQPKFWGFSLMILVGRLRFEAAINGLIEIPPLTPSGAVILLKLQVVGNAFAQEVMLQVMASCC